MQSSEANSKKIDLILVLTLFLPVFAEQLSATGLAVVESMISSNVDTNILNTITLCGSITGIFYTISTCIATGTSILMSQYIGSGNMEKVRKLFSTSMYTGFAWTGLSTVIVLIFRRQMLLTLYPNMSESFIEMASVYLIFAAVSQPIMFYQENTIGIMRGSLNTKSAFYISLAVGIVNILCNFVFMILFEFGIYGRGISIIVSKIIAFIICTVLINKQDYFKGCMVKVRDAFDKSEIVEVFKIGFVLWTQTFALTLGGLVLNKIISTVGDDEMSAYTISTSMFTLLHIGSNALAFVAQILAGKYKGAGEDRKALTMSMNITIASSLLCGVVCLIAYPLTDIIMGLYTDRLELAESIRKCFYIRLLMDPFFWSFGNVLSAGIRGFGNVKQPAITIILSYWLFRIPLSYVAINVMHLGAFGIQFVMSLEFAVYTVSFVGYYIYKMRQIKKCKTKATG